MKTELELLMALHKMYVNGELAAEFDKRTNKMVNSAALQSIRPHKLCESWNLRLVMVQSKMLVLR
jgi:hypothetical protein